MVYDSNSQQMVTPEHMVFLCFMELGFRTGYLEEECGTWWSKMEGMHLFSWANMKARGAMSGAVNLEQLLIDLLGKHEPLKPGYEREFPWQH